MAGEGVRVQERSGRDSDSDRERRRGGQASKGPRDEIGTPRHPHPRAWVAWGRGGGRLDSGGEPALRGPHRQAVLARRRRPHLPAVAPASEVGPAAAGSAPAPGGGPLARAPRRAPPSLDVTGGVGAVRERSGGGSGRGPGEGLGRGCSAGAAGDAGCVCGHRVGICLRLGEVVAVARRHNHLPREQRGRASERKRGSEREREGARGSEKEREGAKGSERGREGA